MLRQGGFLRHGHGVGLRARQGRHGRRLPPLHAGIRSPHPPYHGTSDPVTRPTLFCHLPAASAASAASVIAGTVHRPAGGPVPRRARQAAVGLLLGVQRALLGGAGRPHWLHHLHGRRARPGTWAVLSHLPRQATRPLFTRHARSRARPCCFLSRSRARSCWRRSAWTASPGAAPWARCACTPSRPSSSRSAARCACTGTGASTSSSGSGVSRTRLPPTPTPRPRRPTRNS